MPEPKPAPAHDPPSENTAALTNRGAGFLAARYGLSTLVNVGNVLVLTWWLGPRVYGIFVTAVGITTFLSSIARAGLDTHLVRCKDLPAPRDYQTVFNVIALISLFLGFLGALATPLLRLWLRDSSFVYPYLVLLCTVPLIGLAGVPLARLERNLAFDRVAAIECGGQFTAFVISAALAWRGSGVWAPVAGHIAWQVCVLLAAGAVSGFRPALRTDWRRARAMLNFGLGFSASVRIWQLRNLVNPLLVGRIAGTEAVALVGLALRAVESLSFVRTAAGRVAIAALARIRDDQAQCGRLLERGARLQVLALGPLFCVLALLGPSLLPTLLGIRWSGALAVFPLVAAAGLIHTVFNLEASALFVSGRQWVVARAYSWHVAVLAASTAALAPRIGFAGYGWAELAACVPYFILHRQLSPQLPVSLRKIIPPLALFVVALLSSTVPAWRWLGVVVLGLAIASFTSSAIRSIPLAWSPLRMRPRRGSIV